jgi:ADP-heptose:LPS heptosyltransferase
LEFAGLPLDGKRLELHVPPGVQSSADQILLAAGIQPGVPFVALAPGASCSARRYDPHRFAEAAVKLYKETGLPILLLGSARELGLVEPFEKIASPVSSLIGQTSVTEMAAVIRRAALVIANDSAPMHIADALGRPMVILFSGTELEGQWAPRSAPSRLLRRPTSCSPCYAFRCPYNMECLDISPEEIASEATRLLVESEGYRRLESSLFRGKFEPGETLSLAVHPVKDDLCRNDYSR